MVGGSQPRLQRVMSDESIQNKIDFSNKLMNSVEINDNNYVNIGERQSSSMSVQSSNHPTTSFHKCPIQNVFIGSKAEDPHLIQEVEVDAI